MAQRTTALAYKLQEMAQRIRDLREIAGFTPAEMAGHTGVSLEEYLACERGQSDLNFAFLYRCALALHVDVTEIIEGATPRLSGYTLTRRGAGQQIGEAHSMIYYNMAAQFKNRIAEPLYVRAACDPAAEHRDIELTSHQGQECDIVIRGSLKVQVGSHTEILTPGDSIYYDSATPHGMIAVGGQDCEFYAIVLNPEGEPIPELQSPADVPAEELLPVADAQESERAWHNFITVQEDARGTLQHIEFQNTDSFNFAYDVVDAIAARTPDKLALLFVDNDKQEKRFTFADVSRHSARAANYFKALGIQKGDKVMLVLKRDYHFWFAVLGLHRLGAIVIPATDQLQEKDFVYRFQAAEVNTILCRADSPAIEQADLALASCPGVVHRLCVKGQREGWRNFDEEYQMYRGTFPRDEQTPGGNDLMLMFFTSGTTGYPKIVAHSYKYPLGHFITAKYWHCVDPDGLHLTISDTGWAKAMWGKLYGQWLCEGAIFVYDFERFHADEILPMFHKYRVTTFCAPPTMYRFLIKEDLSKYDLSSIRHASTAGEALNPEVFHRFKEATGLSIMEGFGQSESTIMIGNLRGVTPKLGSMGKAVPLYSITLLDGDGNPVPAGETGEICVDISRGLPCGLTVGYYKDAEKAREVMRNGYYHTGDLAWMDEDGYYWYVGRADDVIKSSGYRIGPFEIESVIMELPYVLECGVSAEKDDLRGQVVKASIVLVKGTQGSDALKKEIQDYVKQRTAPYKYPRIVVFRDELPKTISGKIQRNKL